MVGAESEVDGRADAAADPRTRLLDALLESSQYGLLLLDEHMRVVWISNAGAASLHYDADSLIGRRAGDFLDPAQSQGVLEAVSQALATAVDGAPGWQLSVRVRLCCGDGISRDFEFGGWRLAEAEPSELMVVFLDVSERARLEDVLTAVTEHDIETALQRFLNLASFQLRAAVGIALHPILGGGTYLTPGASPSLLDDLSTDRVDATVCPITPPLGGLFGWLVVANGDLSPWGVETTERLVALLGLVLSNQARMTDLVDAAETDPLTGLANRRVLDLAIESAEATADQGWALLYCDLDRFKTINDDHGHDAGDVVLRRVGERLGHVMRSADVIARIGGDEFVILAHTDLDQTDLLVDRLRASVAQPIVDARGRFEVGVSVGVATANTPEGVHALLGDADAAMRKDKAVRQADR